MPGIDLENPQLDYSLGAFKSIALDHSEAHGG